MDFITLRNLKVTRISIEQIRLLKVLLDEYKVEKKLFMVVNLNLMNTKMDNQEVIFEIKPGDIITTSPGKKEKEYVIEKIFPSYVKVSPANGSRHGEIFYGDELLSGPWRIKS